VKSLVIFATVLWLLRSAIAIVRLAGGVMRDFSDGPLLARTPADFWRRYNRVFHQYFYENVFKRAGGRRSPAAATMLIFAISGLIHEYVFGLGIGRLQGFQMAFFLLEGAAVAATLRVRPKRPATVAVAITATLAFNALVSFFFFLSFHAIVPLYANPLPWWTGMA
jgi:D-alanyl-lipoteichoic acid acyltransferase DltB (MBOAT superfamily)